jgi:transcriptional regulator with XRE-family HTH domain
MLDNQIKKIRQRIKQLFEDSGLKGKEFASKCGITRATLYNIINPESKFAISEKTIASIANRLNVDYDWLISGEGKLSNDLSNKEIKQPENMDQVAMLKEQIQMLKDLVQAQKELSGSATKDKMIKMLEEENDRLKRRLREQGNAGNNGKSKAS